MLATAAVGNIVPLSNTTDVLNLPMIGTGVGITSDGTSIDWGPTYADDVSESELPADTEEFHDFMCWLSGFGACDVPPTKKNWAAFREKVALMCGAFYAYRRDVSRRHGETEAKRSRAAQVSRPSTVGVAGARGTVGPQGYSSAGVTTDTFKKYSSAASSLADFANLADKSSKLF
jgi:hypothetical protein